MKRSCLVYLGIFVGIGILAGSAFVLTIPPTPPGFSASFVMKLGSPLGVGFAASGPWKYGDTLRISNNKNAPAKLVIFAVIQKTI